MEQGKEGIHRKKKEGRRRKEKAKVKYFAILGDHYCVGKRAKGKGG